MKLMLGVLCGAWVSSVGMLGARAAEVPAGGSLESGGLAPPEPIRGDERVEGLSPTEQQLERADREDSGRGLEFVWLNAELGAETVGLQTFKANNLVDSAVVDSKQTGLLYGAGVGLRLLVFTFGARFRLGSFSNWQLWTLNAELGMHLPFGRLEPYFTLGGGYASLGSFDAQNLGTNLNSAGVRVRGFDVRGGFGLDFYLTKTFSIGGNLTGDLLVLSRPGVDPTKLGVSGMVTTPEQAAATAYARDGSGVGTAATLSVLAGLHF